MRLRGRTVVVTRAGDQAGRLSELLRDEGATVVEMPLIAIEDPHDDGVALRAALEELDAFEWLIVTSPNGAARVAALLGSRPVAARIAAIGRGTELALGRPADLVPARHVAEGLLAEFPAGPGRVLLVQGDLARDVLPQGLAALEWDVDRVVAYRNVPARPPAELLARVATADAITFTSASAVRSFVAATGGPDGLPSAVVSIGPITTETAAELGVEITATAADHSLGGLVEAVVEALARQYGR